ncbi:MAG TPA: hypothetical protein VGB99_03010 [Acidobacteriota bacterium]
MNAARHRLTLILGSIADLAYFEGRLGLGGIDRELLQRRDPAALEYGNQCMQRVKQALAERHAGVEVHRLIVGSTLDDQQRCLQLYHESRPHDCVVLGGENATGLLDTYMGYNNTIESDNERTLFLLGSTSRSAKEFTLSALQLPVQHSAGVSSSGRLDSALEIGMHLMTHPYSSVQLYQERTLSEALHAARAASADAVTLEALEYFQQTGVPVQIAEQFRESPEPALLCCIYDSLRTLDAFEAALEARGKIGLAVSRRDTGPSSRDGLIRRLLDSDRGYERILQTRPECGINLAALATQILGFHDPELRQRQQVVFDAHRKPPMSV